MVFIRLEECSMESSMTKSERLLAIYSQLTDGELVSKQALAQKFGVTERSIQRDIDALRCFFSEQQLAQDVVYSRSEKGYRLLKQSPTLLNNDEILAVCKILMDSRSMRRDEMLPIIDKLVACCVPEADKKKIEQMVANEKFHYLEPHHQKKILQGLWQISQAVQEHRVMEIQYERVKDHKTVKRTVEPVGILFSEYYFYLTAFLRDVNRESEFDNKDDCFPTIYRIDRIRAFKVLDEYFYVPYKDRFEEGEFRKRVQFMYGGRLEKIRFQYTGPSVEAVLDRLPTAKVLRQDDCGWEIEAEVFGKGIQMWLRSQGDYIEMK